MTIDAGILKQISTFGVGFAAAFLAALWLSLIFWTFRDIRSRSRDPFMRILAVIIVALLSLPGVLVYLILRPTRTLEEDYQHTLEEEALLQSLEDASLCPGCSRHVQNDWVACPNCHVKLKKICSHCGKAIELPWELCPYCGNPVPGVNLDEDEKYAKSFSLGDEDETKL
jgi:RNA polymerase subunit RPABC4/transcription elongation factor Spt4